MDIFRKPHGVMCKQNKLKNSIPDDKRKECWQPESTEYDAIKYTGKGIKLILINTLTAFSIEIKGSCKFFENFSFFCFQHIPIISSG